MKKLVAILLCSCLCFSLAACSNGGSDDAGTTEANISENSMKTIECKYYNTEDEVFTDQTLITLSVPSNYKEVPQESLVHQKPIYQIGEFKTNAKSIIVYQYLDDYFKLEDNTKLSVDPWVISTAKENYMANFYTKVNDTIIGLSITNLDKSEMTQDNALAALAILLGLSYLEITLVSFLFGILAVSFVLLISSRVRGNPTLTLVLSGMMVSSVFSALISFIKLIADPEEALPHITYFLMGSLSSVRKEDILPVVILIVIAIVPIVILRWSLNIMTQGEEEAKALGVNTKAVRLASIISATIVTATATSLCGMISYVGLVIPHLVRMITGCDYRKTVPASILLGSSFLLLVDTISRSIATVELPIGILTSLIGAPFFLYLIVREAKKL